MIQYVIAHLFGPSRGIDHFHTGSRYFGDSTEASDWDWVLHVNESDCFDELAGKLAELGFEPCHNPYTDDKHLIVRRASDNLNLIFTNSFEKYQMWELCTFVSTQLKLSKDQRKVLFSAMVDDKDE